MRIAITGATGNVGTSLIQSLENESAVESIRAIARRRPAVAMPKVEWIAADVARDDLAALFDGVDAVVHLAWLIQPERDLALLTVTNVHGSQRTFEAVAQARVPVLVYASSVGAYSPGPKDRCVDERWPTGGIQSAIYSRQKAAVEALLDAFERRHANVRVVRMRPALIFKRASGSEQRRLFLGPLFPAALARPGRIPVVPIHPRFRFQAVHSLDVGEAYRLALVRQVSGAFNLAADPILDGHRLARLLHARRIPVTPRVLHVAAAIAWRLHLTPASAGWIDMAFGAPLMAIGRARRELGWEARHSAEDAVLEVLRGMADHAGLNTPPLKPSAWLGRTRRAATGEGHPTS